MKKKKSRLRSKKERRLSYKELEMMRGGGGISMDKDMSMEDLGKVMDAVRKMTPKEYEDFKATIPPLVTYG